MGSVVSQHDLNHFELHILRF